MKQWGEDRYVIVAVKMKKAADLTKFEPHEDVIVVVFCVQTKTV